MMELQTRYRSLTNRERQVLPLVTERVPQQADRRGTRRRRKDSQDSSRSGNGKDESRFGGRPGAHGHHASVFLHSDLARTLPVLAGRRAEDLLDSRLLGRGRHFESRLGRKWKSVRFLAKRVQLLASCRKAARFGRISLGKIELKFFPEGVHQVGAGRVERIMLLLPPAKYSTTSFRSLYAGMSTKSLPQPSAAPCE
jgi:hypothetical protein